MKQYRHKQTGITAIQMGELANQYYSVKLNALINAEIIENSQDWEEVVEKEYEILSIKSKGGDFLTKTKDSEDVFYSSKLIGCWISLKDFKNYCIHSVKRLSDGVIFTIGDLIDFDRKGRGVLTRIDFERAPADKGTGKLCFVNDNQYLGDWWNINALSKADSPLFTTHDGKEIYKGDEFFVVDKKFDSYKIHQTIGGHFTKEHPCRLRFSSKVLAESYVLMNKPCFSINDIININPYMAMQIEKFREIAKSKISNL